MADIQAADILRPRWNPAFRARAQRFLVLAGLGLLGVGVVGRVVATTLLDNHPAALLLLGAGPVLTGLVLLVAAGVLAKAPVVGRFIAAYTAPVFFGGAITAVVGIWIYSMAVRLMTGIAPSGTDGLVTTMQIRQALPGPLSLPVVSWLLWPLQFGIVRDIVILAGVVGFVSVLAMFAIWWERKVSGRIQSRLGPMRTGGWHGWAQSLADGIKLIGKEDLIPAGADQLLFRLAPYLAFVPALCAFIALPFAASWVFRDLDVGLVFVLAMLGIEVIGVILGGWASNNKWSLYGAMREACQMVSYEIPMGMALLIPVMTAGTLSLAAIGNQQDGGWHTWLAFRNPFTFFALFAYYIASLASCKRAPFDLPEAESELVAGFMTEYSGFRWCLFFFAEYAGMFVVSALATVLFLGAWHSPLPASWGRGLSEGGPLAQAVYGLAFSGPLWFVFKGVFGVFVQMWIRWTLPRIRIDQVLYLCVQVLLPMAMLALLGNTLWELLVPAGGVLAAVANGFFSLVGAGMVATFVAVMLYGRLNRRRLVGRLVIDHLPGA